MLVSSVKSEYSADILEKGKVYNGFLFSQLPCRVVYHLLLDFCTGYHILHLCKHHICQEQGSNTGFAFLVFKLKKHLVPTIECYSGDPVFHLNNSLQTVFNN